jgi:hypothetical protein
MIEGYFKRGQATGYARWIWADGLSYQGSLINFKCDGTGTRIQGDNNKDVIETIVYKQGKVLKSFKETSQSRTIKNQLGV